MRRPGFEPGSQGWRPYILTSLYTADVIITDIIDAAIDAMLCDKGKIRL